MSVLFVKGRLQERIQAKKSFHDQLFCRNAIAFSLRASQRPEFGRIKPIFEETLMIGVKQIDLETRLLDDLRRQADRTGDYEGFAADIDQQQDAVDRLKRKLDRARSLVRQWEGQAAIIEREMIANGCGNFA